MFLTETVVSPGHEKDVYSVPAEIPAAERARWLAELSGVLNEAHHLIQRLELREDQHALAKELHLQIEAVRFEVQSLMLSRSLQPRPESPPEWSQLPPWMPGRRIGF